VGFFVGIFERCPNIVVGFVIGINLMSSGEDGKNDVEDNNIFLSK
jgi:hypothetical protein